MTDPEVLAQGCYHLNRVLTAQARYDEAEQAIVRAPALCEHLQLRTEVGTCRFAIGAHIAFDRGDDATGEALPGAAIDRDEAASVYRRGLLSVEQSKPA